jgi:hypothetical protein
MDLAVMETYCVPIVIKNVETIQVISPPPTPVADLTLGITAADIHQIWENSQALNRAAYEEKLKICLPLWLNHIKQEIEICIRGGDEIAPIVRPKPMTRIFVKDLEEMIPSEVPRLFRSFSGNDFCRLAVIVQKGTDITMDHARGHIFRCDCGSDGCADIIEVKWKWKN